MDTRTLADEIIRDCVECIRIVQQNSNLRVARGAYLQNIIVLKDRIASIDSKATKIASISSNAGGRQTKRWKKLVILLLQKEARNLLTKTLAEYHENKTSEDLFLNSLVA